MDHTLTNDSVALGHTLAQEAASGSALGGELCTGSARYARGRELGRGGMGRVFEAVDQQFNRAVAVKEIASDHPSESTLRRFTTEAIVTGHLEHPGIPSVYERGVDSSGRPFYAMRRVHGRTLAKLLAEADTREKRIALLPVVTRVAQTIGFAHERGVIHRDIKPDNILVGDHGETVVLDWGLARVRGVPGPVDDPGPSGPVATSGTLHGTVIGTPAYMAPEQAAGDIDRIDERSDVFALGALLYHVLAGAPPYRGASVNELLDAARAARFPLLEPSRELPRELVAICSRATARDPVARYRNAHELARALEGFEASAVLAGSSRVNMMYGILMIGIVVLSFVGLIVTIASVSSITEQGTAAQASIITGVLGCIVSIVEWRSRGRYRLGAAGFGFALATFFVAVGGVAEGMSIMFRGLAAHEMTAEAYRMTLAEGLYELIGALAIGSILAAVQLALWAIARRRSQPGGAII